MVNSQELRLRIGVDGAEQAKAKVGGLGASIGSMVKTLAPAAAGLMAVRTAVRTLSDSISFAREQVEVQRILASQIQTTGMAAGFTAEQFANIATELQSISNYGDEDILKNVTIPLTTFKQISGQVFTDAQQAILDMATAMDMDLRSAAIMVGKALNDPVRGMNAMTRAGVSFTEAERNMIQDMVETNRTLDAQKTILSALQGQFGGAAQAGVNSSTQLKNAWGDFLEEIGKNTLPVLDAVNLALVNFFTVSASNMAEYNKSVEGSQREQFRLWNDFVTAFILNGETVLRVVYTVITKAFSLCADAGKLIGETLIVPLNALYNTVYTIVETFSQIPSKGIKAFSGLGSRLWDSFGSASSEVTKTFNHMLSTFKSGISDIGNTFSNYDNKFYDITQRSQTQFNTQIELNKKLKKSLDDLGSDSGGAGAGAGTFPIITPEIDDNQFQKAQQYYEQIMRASETALQSMERNYLEQKRILTEYYEAGTLEGAKYYLALDELEKDFTAKKKAYLAEQAEAEKQANQDRIDATVSMLREIEDKSQGMAYYYQQYRVKQILAEAEVYKAQGVEQVFIERWVADQMRNIWDDYYDENKEKLENGAIDMKQYAESIKQSIEDEIGDALYDMIMQTDSVLADWNSFWNSMLRILVKAVTEMIAKLIMLKFWQTVTGTGVGGAVPDFPAGATDIPPIGTIASVGGGSVVGGIGGNAYGGVMLSTNTGRNISALADRLDRLATAIENNPPQIYTQMIEGVPLHKAVTRARIVANEL